MSDKIRIRLLTHASGPHFQLAPGEHDVGREHAEAMLAGGFAERVEVSEMEAPETPEQEHAAEEPQLAATTVETATAVPQRSQEADDLVAVERTGAAAAEAKEERRAPDGVDGRSARGRAWYRGYDSYRQEYRAPAQGQ
jgi:hypothetical protein